MINSTNDDRLATAACSSGDGWLARFDGLPPVVQEQVAEALLGKTIEIHISPTERCNFRCRYCYEDFKIGRMNSDVVERVKLFAARNIFGKNGCHVAWFGGEPLLAADIVLDIQRHVLSSCVDGGIKLTGSMTTNAYLLDERCARALVDLKVHDFQVSFDGAADAHDKLRVAANGSGTFIKIWSNLLQLHKSDINFLMLIRIHIHPHNFDSVRELVRQFSDAFNGDQRFQLLFRPVTNLGGGNGGTFKTLSQQEFVDRLNLVKEEFSHLQCFGEGNPRADKTIKGVECGAHVCYASKPNAYHIRPDGRVGKCTVALDRDYNLVGELTPDGSIRLQLEKLRRWTNGLKTLDISALSCPASILSKRT